MEQLCNQTTYFKCCMKSVHDRAITTSRVGPDNDAVVLYQAKDGSASLEVRLQEETVWLSLTQMADLFGRDKSVIPRHLRNIFREGELARAAVVAKNATTTADGKTYQVEFFNLDAIISVGYRVAPHAGAWIETQGFYPT